MTKQYQDYKHAYLVETFKILNTASLENKNFNMFTLEQLNKIEMTAEQWATMSMRRIKKDYSEQNTQNIQESIDEYWKDEDGNDIPADSIPF